MGVNFPPRLTNTSISTIPVVLRSSLLSKTFTFVAGFGTLFGKELVELPFNFTFFLFLFEIFFFTFNTRFFDLSIAVKHLSQSRHGALIMIKREDSLDRIIHSGI